MCRLSSPSGRRLQAWRLQAVRLLGARGCKVILALVAIAMCVLSARFESERVAAQVPTPASGPQVEPLGRHYFLPLAVVRR